MNTPAPRPRILDITPYKGGLSKSNSTKRTIKLSSNETPFGPSPKAIEAYKNACHNLHKYPNSMPLCQTIAQTYNLNPDQIVCGAGSDELISLLCLAYAGPGDDVLYSQYGFLMYPISTMAVGANPIAVPETADLKADINAIIESVTQKTKIVFIANPNNPTGSYLTRDEILQLRRGLPDHVLLVLDGAYAEYVSLTDYTDGTDIVDMGQNTVITRTFSKIYGLASLRVGWAYCPEAIADILNRVRGPFNVSGPAIEAACAALNDQPFLEKAKAHNDLWLPWLDTALSDLGLDVAPSIANFVLVTFPKGEKQALAANAFLMEQGIIARPVTNYGLPASIRFTIGLEDENKAVVDCLKQFLSTNKAS